MRCNHHWRYGGARGWLNPFTQEYELVPIRYCFICHEAEEFTKHESAGISSNEWIPKPSWNHKFPFMHEVRL